MTLILQGPRARMATVPLLFRASECLDDEGIFALAFGRKVRGVFSRSSLASTLDQAGRVRVLAAGQPRLRATPSGVTLALESSRTNLCLRSDEVDNASWGKSSAGAGLAPVVSSDAGFGPDGTARADRVTFSAAGAGDQSMIGQSGIVTIAASPYALSFHIKAWSAVDIGKTVIFRGAGGAAYGAVVLSGEWQRVERVEVASTTSSSFTIGLRPGFQGSSSGVVDALVTAVQFEEGLHSSTYARSGGTAGTRASESLYLPFNARLRAMTLYLRGRERGTFLQTSINRRYFSIGSDATSAGSLSVYGVGGTNALRGLWQNSAGASATSDVVAPAVSIGDLLELRLTVSAAGLVRLFATINGGNEAAGSLGAAVQLEEAVAMPRVWLNSRGAGIQEGFFDFANLCVAYDDRSLSEMRELAGVG